MSQFDCIIHQAKKRWPEAIAIEYGGEQLSYRQLDARVSAVAHTLRHCDLKTTLRLYVTGCLDDIINLLAAQRMALCVLPLNPLSPESWLNTVTSGLPLSDWPSSNDLSSDQASPVGLSQLGITAHPRQSVSIHTPLHWILTSGSTGTPKVAVLSAGNHHYSAVGSMWCLHSQVGDRYWMSLPLYHVGGLSQIFRCFLSGATLVLPTEKLSAVALSHAQITHLSLVPTQLQRLLDASPQALVHCKSILLGGAPAPAKLLQRAAHLPIQTTYGLTEMASQVVTRQSNGVHRLLPYRELRISASGEVLVRGDTLFLGYQTPNGLEPAVDEQGWFHTRDTGIWDGKSLSITGRLDNQFISGGENIQPESLERIALEHPHIEQAVVVPVTDLEFGQRPVMFIAGQIEIETFLTWMLTRIPKHAKPKAVYRLPPSEALKINRQQLQQQAEQQVHGYLA